MKNHYPKDLQVESMSQHAGGQPVYGKKYWDTYTPVVSWPVIHFFHHSGTEN